MSRKINQGSSKFYQSLLLELPFNLILPNVNFQILWVHKPGYCPDQKLFRPNAFKLRDGLNLRNRRNEKILKFFQDRSSRPVRVRSVTPLLANTSTRFQGSPTDRGSTQTDQDSDFPQTIW